MGARTEATALWRLPDWANERFEHLLAELDNYSEDSNEYDTIIEEIKGLPGFPVGLPTHVVIRRVVTTTRSR